MLKFGPKTCQLRLKDIKEICQELSILKITWGWLPSKKDVLGCYHTPLDNEKSKQKRIKIIHEELINLWKKMSFPILSEQAIIARIKKLIGEYERNQRYPKQKFKTLNSVFDITKTEGQ